jgi:prepilin-type processing-associated H-X9-DG protein
LVELLAVVGIISIILALLVPATARARRQARSVVCLSNLRQLGTAFQIYVGQNKGKGLIAYGSPENYWLRVLRPYLHEGARDVVYCPEAPDNVGYPVLPFPGAPYCGTAFHAWANKNYIDGKFVIDVESSYGMNGWVSALRPTGTPPSGDESTRDMYFTLPAKESDNVPLFADCIAVGTFPLHTDTPPENLYTPIPTTGMNYSANGMYGVCIARHGRAINIVFLDGHAQTVRLPELWKLKWHRNFVPTEMAVP